MIVEVNTDLGLNNLRGLLPEQEQRLDTAAFFVLYIHGLYLHIRRNTCLRCAIGGTRRSPKLHFWSQSRQWIDQIRSKRSFYSLMHFVRLLFHYNDINIIKDCKLETNIQIKIYVWKLEYFYVEIWKEILRLFRFLQGLKCFNRSLLTGSFVHSGFGIQRKKYHTKR